MEQTEKRFRWPDYCVVAASLTLSMGTGVLFLLKGRKKQGTAEDFLMAGRQMGVVPVACSIFVR